jgi:signal peptidase I
MLKILRVSGNSLFPKFSEGDFVIVCKIPFFFYKNANQGDIIVFKHVDYGLMMKKVESFSPDGQQVWVVGTHPDSTDSRDFGFISMQSVIGKVICHIPKPPNKITILPK